MGERESENMPTTFVMLILPDDRAAIYGEFLIWATLCQQ